MQAKYLFAAFAAFAVSAFMLPVHLQAQVVEISGSPFAIEGAPLPEHLDTSEKTILVDPREHVWGAYNANGKLIRWGIAAAGSDICSDADASCRTKTGVFRIYMTGNENCVSNKYKGAPMPYCMYFSGSQALHGSSEVEFENISHGCVRIHIDDAKWLRYNFAEAPDAANHYLGTRIIITPY